MLDDVTAFVLMGGRRKFSRGSRPPGVEWSGDRTVSMF